MANENNLKSYFKAIKTNNKINNYFSSNFLDIRKINYLVNK